MTHIRKLAGLAAAIGVLAAAPAVSAGPVPLTETYEDAGNGKWVLEIGGSDYGGATGTVTFKDTGYVGPSGASVNDFRIKKGYKPRRPSFSQNVVVKPQDWLTRDPTSSPMNDDVVGAATGSAPMTFRDANMDGNVNLGPFAWTTPPGTRFVNMQIDKAGNYFVAKQDMQWGFFDTFLYQAGSAEPTEYDTSFNFQPYPLSDAYGWCGSVLTRKPTALQRQSGQLVFDMAFDVYFGDASEGMHATQVVPGFVMRSYGSYEVDVTVSGIRQQFGGSAVGINYNPVTGALDRAFYQQVSAVGAGVIPAGAWVLDEGESTMRVVTEDTAGATWHRNDFAGYAYILRGDIDRSVVDRPGVKYKQRKTWTDYRARKGKGY